MHLYSAKISAKNWDAYLYVLIKAEDYYSGETRLTATITRWNAILPLDKQWSDEFTLIFVDQRELDNGTVMCL